MHKPKRKVIVKRGVAAEDYFPSYHEVGFDVVSLPAAEYLMFQGEPFREEDYSEAILAVQHAMKQCDPSVIGYEWNEEKPRIQLEPRGERGYIEMRAVKQMVA